MPPSGRLQARHKLLAPSHARNIAPPIRIAASEPGQTASNTDNPRPHAMAIVVLAAAAPIAVTYPARRPPSSVLRTTTAVVDPGVTTRMNVNERNAK